MESSASRRARPPGQRRVDEPPRVRLSKFGKAPRPSSHSVSIALYPSFNQVMPGKRRAAVTPGGSNGCSTSVSSMPVTPSSNPSCQDLLTLRIIFICSIPPALATSARTSGGRPESQSTFILFDAGVGGNGACKRQTYCVNLKILPQNHRLVSTSIRKGPQPIAIRRQQGKLNSGCHENSIKLL